MFKKNILFYVFLLFIIFLGSVGITLSLKISQFNPININVNTGKVDAIITYNSGSNNNIVNFTGLSPIDDSLIINSSYKNNKVLRVEFNVQGSSSNPANSIYDISFRDLNIPCELKNSNLKWRLYKNGSLLSNGDLSQSFDIKENNRLVLTNTQQDLTNSIDRYVFMLWISESCTGDISTCNFSQSQNKYLNKTLTGNIKIEMLTKTKNNLVRRTGPEDVC